MRPSQLKKGDKAGGGGMQGGRGRLAGGKKESGSPCIWRLMRNFLEHLAVALGRPGGRVGIG